jgi:hypothetical protein
MAQFIRISALAWLALVAVPAYADPRAELAQARHDLDVSEQVLARIAERVQVVRADPATGAEQRLRLDAYLAHVQDLVAANRERVRTLAQQVGALPAGTSVATPGHGTTRTDAEEVAALDAKLGESLSTFDELLLDEARKARIRERREGGGGASGAGTGGGDAGGARGSRSAKGETGAPGTRGAGGEPGPAGAPDSGNDAQGPVSEEGSPGGRVAGDRPGTPGGGAATPPDVGNGNDDDIVARQIRKAAETEPDPELRKKLWEEYRKYKQGAKG